MKPREFVLALPKAETGAVPAPLKLVHRIENVCAGGPRLWKSEETPLIELAGGSKILGVLFSRGSNSPVTALAASAPLSSNASSFGAWLIREYWGGYLAIFCDAGTGAFGVMADPSGHCPAYHIQTETHVLIASHPFLLQRVAGKTLKVSWHMLHNHLLRPDLRQRATCLAGVSELAPGELVINGDISSPCARLWRPDAFMPSDVRLTFDEAAEELRSISISVMGSWAGLFGPVAVAASGGVDSSLICAALARADVPFSCITLTTADPSGDERPFVQLLGDHFGVRTIAATYALDAINPMRSASAGLARPTRKSFMAALDSALFDVAHSVDAKVVFDGNGGDNIFCYLHSAVPVADHLRCVGPGRATLSTFLDMCRLTGCDIPHMTRAVMRRLFRGSDFGPWLADTRLLAHPFNDHCLDPLSPWFNTDVGRHRGKYDHLALIMRTQNYVHGITPGGLPRFSPLMSQPLVEFCLGIPTWMWCEGGINRALARAAFAADLPREIVSRSSKAGPDSFVRQIFQEHRATIQQLLMDGVLVEHDLLDRAALETALQSDGFAGGSIVYRLLDLAEAENWARSWHD